MPQSVRSILAVLAGFLSMMVVVVACTLASVALLHLKSGNPTPGYLVLNVVYSLAGAFLGGWVTARLAGVAPVGHGVALAVLIVLLSALSYVHYTGLQPLGYQIFVTVFPPFAAIAGAAIVRRR
jgi:uncharacterized membrane protein YfcA